MGLQVDEDGGVGLATSQGEIVDTEDRRCGGDRLGLAANEAQESIRTRRQAIPGGNSRSGLTSGDERNLEEDVADFLRPTGIAGQRLAAILGES